MKRLAAAMLCGVMPLLFGCSATDQRTEVHAHGVAAFPGDTMKDWVTYGDYAVEWDVLSERRLAPTAEEVEHDEGTITRLVTMKTSKVVWKRTTAPTGLVAPTTLEVANGGWVFHGKEEKPFVMDDAPRLEVGKRYLALLAYTDLTLLGSGTPAGPEWIAVDWVPLTSGTVTPPKTSPNESADSTSESLAGKDSAGVKSVLSSTSADTLAKSYMSVDPVLRYQKVAEAAQASSSYTPGPGPGEKE